MSILLMTESGLGNDVEEGSTLNVNVNVKALTKNTFFGVGLSMSSHRTQVICEKIQNKKWRSKDLKNDWALRQYVNVM